jgi:hypothetical protein
MPKCKNSDSDCDAVRQYARAKQAAADAAARDLSTAEDNLSNADSADKHAASLYDYGNRSLEVAAGYGKLRDKSNQEAYPNLAKEA